jgi:hypothetical protein
MVPPSMPPLSPGELLCKGKFLLELVDDSAIFAGLFITIGFFAYAWVMTGKMPHRGEGRILSSLNYRENDDADSAVEKEEGGGGDEKGGTVFSPQGSSGGGVVVDSEVQERLRELEEQVKRLVAREGQSKGLLGGQDTGRRARSSKGLFKRKKANSGGRSTEHEQAEASASARSEDGTP